VNHAKFPIRNRILGSDNGYKQCASPTGEEGELMKQAMKITQWILGIAAVLSLIIGFVYKIIYVFAQGLLPYTSPMGFLVFAVACSLVSIALSLIKLVKLMEKE
jgi:phosphoglycerol transferase MdoB-like AlkP superfamily enzyme